MYEVVVLICGFLGTVYLGFVIGVLAAKRAARIEVFRELDVKLDEQGQVWKRQVEHHHYIIDKQGKIQRTIITGTPNVMVQSTGDDVFVDIKK